MGAELSIPAEEYYYLPRATSGAVDIAGSLPSHLVPAVLGYLTASELCAARGASKSLLLAERAHAQPLWRDLSIRDFGKCTELACLGAGEAWDGHTTYLRLVLRFATQELAHLAATAHVRGPLAAYAEAGGGVVGIVSDLGYLADERIARAVSHRRRLALPTAVVTSHRVIANFRRRSGHHGPINFIPLEAMVLDGAAAGDKAAADALRLKRRPPLPPKLSPGFLGYAVDLFVLPEQQEFLRETVLHTLFRDLSVWETAAEAEQWHAASGVEEELYYCSLDVAAAVPTDGVPYISHWGPRPPLAQSCAEEERLQALALSTRTALAYVLYGGGL